MSVCACVRVCLSVSVPVSVSVSVCACACVGVCVRALLAQQTSIDRLFLVGELTKNIVSSTGEGLTAAMPYEESLLQL